MVPSEESCLFRQKSKNHENHENENNEAKTGKILLKFLPLDIFIVLMYDIKSLMFIVH